MTRTGNKADHGCCNSSQPPQEIPVLLGSTLDCPVLPLPLLPCTWCRGPHTSAPGPQYKYTSIRLVFNKSSDGVPLWSDQSPASAAVQRRQKLWYTYAGTVSGSVLKLHLQICLRRQQMRQQSSKPTNARASAVFNPSCMSEDHPTQRL